MDPQLNHREELENSSLRAQKSNTSRLIVLHPSIAANKALVPSLRVSVPRFCIGLDVPLKFAAIASFPVTLRGTAQTLGYGNIGSTVKLINI